MGKYNETATAGIFWDIYDDFDDDYSGQSDWGDTTRPHTPDNIGDTLSDGIANILDVLLNRSWVHGHNPDNITEFWYAWFAEAMPGHGRAMEDIWYEHGELAPQIPGCCNGDGKRGDVDGQGGPGGEVDVAI